MPGFEPGTSPVASPYNHNKLIHEKESMAELEKYVKTGLVFILIYSKIHVTNYFLFAMFYLRLFMSQTVLFVHVLPFAHT